MSPSVLLRTLWVLLLFGCDRTPASPPDLRPLPRLVPRVEPVFAMEEDATSWRPVYRFLDNRLFAHRSQQGALLWLGGPEALTVLSPEAASLGLVIEGERAALLKGQKLTLRAALSPEEKGAVLLRARVKPRAAGDVLSAKLFGQKLGEVPLQEGWQTVALPLPEGLLRTGENILQLSFRRSGAAVAWLHLALPGAPLPTPSPLLVDASPARKQRRALSVPPQGALSFHLFPPPGAELRFSLAAKGEGGCRFFLSALKDGQPRPEVLFVSEHQNAGSWEEVRLRLGAYTGEPIRLSLAARGPGCQEGAFWGEPTLFAPLLSPPPGGEKKGSKEENDEGSPTPLKNLIFWIIDTQRADSFDFYNPETRVKTPHLSRFATHATVFESCYAGGNESQAGAASLHSGTYPFVHRMFQEKGPLPAELITLAEALSQEGFFTAGLSANGYVSKRWQLDQGFSSFYNFIHAGKPWSAEHIWKKGRALLEELRGRKERFFLYLHTADPHVPYTAHKGIIERYEPGPYRERYPHAVSGHETGKIRGGSLKLTPTERAHVRALYDNEVEYNDLYFGELWRYLEETGLDKETLLVVTADHGEEMFEHGERRIGHGRSLYQEVIWIPLLIYAPGLAPQGGRVVVDVEGVDILPTVLDALGVKIPETVQGESLLPLTREANPYPRAAISSWFLQQYAVKMGPYKAVFRESGEGQLFDLSGEEREAKDIAAERPIAAQLLREVFSFHCALQGEWKKRLWGLPSNHAPTFAEAMERRIWE